MKRNGQVGPVNPFPPGIRQSKNNNKGLGYVVLGLREGLYINVTSVGIFIGC